MKSISNKRVSAYMLVVAALIGLATTTWVKHVRAGAEQQRITAATVHITTIANSPDYSKPWQSKGTETFTASGAIIAGNRIITNAHAVVYAASIEVKRPGLQKSFAARVEHIDHGCDLALLTVADPEFFANVTPLVVGALPAMGSVVTAYGYPVGGETVSATSGVVSRLEHDTYANSQRDLVVAQVDAAINSGNSGGPVIGDGKIVGIAMQTLESGENVGYIIPAPVIDRFLVDVADGAVAGVPTLGAYWLAVENDALRDYLGLGEKQTGAVVANTTYGGSSWNKLKADDVIMAIDGISVANDGTIPLGKDARVNLDYVIEKKQVGDAAEVLVWRDRASVRLSISLNTTDLLIPTPVFADRCTYRIAGGLVFQPVTTEYLLSLGEHINSSLLHPWATMALRTEARREMVIVTDVLPHSVNRGYQEWKHDIVETVQGVPVRDFAHLNELLDNATGQWLNLTLDDKSRLVMDLAASRAATEEILRGFSIPEDRWPSSATANVAQK